jgi:hypothetical protein
VIPAVPSTAARGEVRVSSTPAPAATPTAAAKTAPQQKSSSRVVLAVFVGIALLAVAVVSRNHTSTSTSTNTATPSESASAAPDASQTASAAPTSTPTEAVATSENPAPEGIVAHYTSTGATIFWKAASGATGLTNFNIEIRANGGEWKLISTVPATQFSLDITKQSADGWSSFRVSAVYGSTIVGGKVFGLPGQYA